MKINILRILFILIAGFQISNSFACTTAIISGKFTVDGRPLLWKHRDCDAVQTAMMYFTDGKFDYTGLIDADDPKGENVWSGANSVGFAIMNSASYNLILSDTVKQMDREGIIMKMALQQCTTVDDFEQMLKNLPKPLGVEANFGVIDAQGGAAYFEVNNFVINKIDVNDPKIAPFGYVIRTNYSFTGKADAGYGYIRYLSAQDLMFNAVLVNNLTVKYIIQNMSRCLKHYLTKTDLTKEFSDNPAEPRYMFFEDYIPRPSTAASIVIQGVKKGESPVFTTIWTVLGFPLASVVVPVWVCKGVPMPEILTLGKDSVAPLCYRVEKLKEKLFPIKMAHTDRYINVNALFNGQNSGIMQKLKPLEDKIFDETDKKMQLWRKTGINPKEIQAYYQWLNSLVLNEYNTLFGL
jgi:uncharacterized lipoprotein NlpE involved in copper resistance